MANQQKNQKQKSKDQERPVSKNVLFDELRKSHPKELAHVLGMTDDEKIKTFYHLLQSDYRLEEMGTSEVIMILEREYLQQMVEEVAGDYRALANHNRKINLG